MTPRRVLGPLQRAFGRRAHRLALLVRQQTNLAPSEADRLASYICLELSSLWDSLVRVFYLSIMYGTRTTSGRRVTCAGGYVSTTEDAIRRAVVLFNPTFPPTRSIRPRDEPDWFQPTTITRLAQRYSFSNFAEIQLALSYPTLAWKLLPTFRNFYAHKDRGTADKVRAISRRYFSAHDLTATQTLVLPRSVSSPSFLEEWVHDLKLIGTGLMT